MAETEARKVTVSEAKKVTVMEARKVAVTEAQKGTVRATVVRLETHMRGKELTGTGEKKRSEVFSFCFICVMLWCLFSELAILCVYIGRY